MVNFELPDYKDLGIPDNVMRIAGMTKGFVLVTGPAGSGKSTTLACIIDAINTTRDVHIITLEDPIEYLHRHKKSVVSQREVSTDTDSYEVALRAALRQAPDVIDHKAESAAGRVVAPLAGLGFHQPGHHINEDARGEVLARAGLFLVSILLQQPFVQVAQPLFPSGVPVQAINSSDDRSLWRMARLL